MDEGIDQVAARLIHQIREESGLKQIELARRSGIQSSVLSAYEHGERQPSVAALTRIAGAAGLEVRVGPSLDKIEMLRAGDVLVKVIELAEQMPYKPRKDLAYPPLARLAG
ncbi:MAG: helix-turn-helix transcriptional regulator [Solirubrobacteraceae bacterium]|jgi:transcriptional regulator with XRE-family HTH domain